MKQFFGALAVVAIALIFVTALNSGNAANVALATTTSTPSPSPTPSPTPTPPAYQPALGAQSSGWQPLVSVNDAATVFNLPSNTSSCVVEVEGSLSSFTVAVEMSNDGVHWDPTQNTRPTPAPSASPGLLAANGQIQINPAQFRGVRARLATTGGGFGYALVTCGPAYLTKTGGIGK